MLKNKVLLGSLAAMISLAACGFTKSTATSPVPLPSPVDKWTVQMSQSGGIAGVVLTVDVSSDGLLRAEDQRSGRSVTQTLPPEAIAQLRQLVSSTKVPSGTLQRSSCADCFIYDLEIQSSASNVRIHADDVTLNDSGAAALIAFLRRARDNALASQP